MRASDLGRMLTARLPAGHQVWRRARTGRLPGLRTLKLTVAAIASFLLAGRVVGLPDPVLAPLTAVLVVQLTLDETVRYGIRRVVAVVAGVAVAIAIASVTGMSWWSLGVIIIVSVVVGRLLRLGGQLTTVPVVAMFVLKVGAGSASIVSWISATLLGALVGIGTNLLIAPPLHVQTAGRAVERVAARLGGLLRRMADDLDRGWSVDDATGWLTTARRLSGELHRASRVLEQAQRSMRLNPRRRQVEEACRSLESALWALERAGVAVRETCRALCERAERSPESSPYDAALHTSLAWLLRACAEVVDAFGALAVGNRDDVTGPTADRARLREALEIAHDSREALEGPLAVDPREDPGLWELNGTLVGSIDRLLRELDVDTGSVAQSVPRAGARRAGVVRTVLPHRKETAVR